MNFRIWGVKFWKIWGIWPPWILVLAEPLVLQCAEANRGKFSSGSADFMLSFSAKSLSWAWSPYPTEHFKAWNFFDISTHFKSMINFLWRVRNPLRPSKQNWKKIFGIWGLKFFFQRLNFPADSKNAIIFCLRLKPKKFI